MAYFLDGSFRYAVVQQCTLVHVAENFDLRIVHSAASVLHRFHGLRLVANMCVPNVLFVLAARELRPGDENGVTIGNHLECWPWVRLLAPNWNSQQPFLDPGSI